MSHRLVERNSFPFVSDYVTGSFGPEIGVAPPRFVTRVGTLKLSPFGCKSFLGSYLRPFRNIRPLNKCCLGSVRIEPRPNVAYRYKPARRSAAGDGRNRPESLIGDELTVPSCPPRQSNVKLSSNTPRWLNVQVVLAIVSRSPRSWSGREGKWSDVRVEAGFAADLRRGDAARRVAGRLVGRPGAEPAAIPGAPGAGFRGPDRSRGVVHPGLAPGGHQPHRQLRPQAARPRRRSAASSA